MPIAAASSRLPCSLRCLAHRICSSKKSIPESCRLVSVGLALNLFFGKKCIGLLSTGFACRSIELSERNSSSDRRKRIVDVDPSSHSMRASVALIGSIEWLEPKPTGSNHLNLDKVNNSSTLSNCSAQLATPRFGPARGQ
jgi:hypothetical protein